jgi:primosomal protein N' (replication factor Y)
MYAEIIIPLAVPKNYTWAIPDKMLASLQPGCRVEVNLGKNKKYSGIIKKVHDVAPTSFEAKDILNVLDVEPVVQPYQLDFWKWLAAYYMCTEGEVMSAAMPAHFKLSSETVLVFNEEYGSDLSDLDNEEYLVAEALLMKHELKLTEVQQILDVPHVYPLVNRLIGKKLCFVWELLNNWSRAPKQM